jgi:hypothetical protein
MNTSVVDWHRFDADPDPNFHVDDNHRVQIWIGIKMMRILPKVSHMQSTTSNFYDAFRLSQSSS